MTGLTFAQLNTQLLASGLSRPNCVAFPRNDARLFIVEQYPSGSGRIRILKSGSVLSTPFLTVPNVSLDSEQGLLGIVFHPNYASNGYFYISYCNAAGDVVIERFSVSANPDVANSSSGYKILTIDRPRANHNGGTMQFGPDGYLYFGMGDSGGSYDPDNAAQDKNLLLGKILRLDVDQDAFPLDTTKNYAVPATNPYVGLAGADEILHYGLRNPWKHRFDLRDSNGYDGYFIADVGQEDNEEIDYIRPGDFGQNFGWRVYEGTRATGLGGGTGPFTDPLFDYTHASGCSVSGGVLYRGVRLGPQYYGRFFFSDYCGGFLWSLGVLIDPNSGAAFYAGLQDHGLALNFGVTSLDIDVNGELVYVRQGGTVRRVVSTQAYYGAFGSISFLSLDAGARKPSWATVEMRQHGSTTNLYEFTIGLNQSGTFKLPTTNGNLDLSVKHSHWLRKTVQIDTASADATNVNIALINGDVLEDNEINIVDIALIATSFGSVPGDSEWNSNADLDGDGEVNLIDAAIVSTNFGLMGDD